MEKELFHHHLEELYRVFGRDTVFISLRQAASYCHKNPRTLESDKTFPVKVLGSTKSGRKVQNVPLINLARWLS